MMITLDVSGKGKIIPLRPHHMKRSVYDTVYLKSKLPRNPTNDIMCVLSGILIFYGVTTVRTYIPIFIYIIQKALRFSKGPHKD